MNGRNGNGNGNGGRRRRREIALPLDGAQVAAGIRDFFHPARLQRAILLSALGLSLLAALYWGLIASDRYVSEAHVIIQRTDLAGSGATDFSSLLGGTPAGHSDQLLLRDHLLSLDMLNVLESRLKLREHFSSWRRDPLSRIWFSRMPMERFKEYFLSRVSVEYDEYTGVLVLRAQAFDPATAHAIAAAMVEEGERHMNGMAHALAREQVAFIERQATELGERSNAARRKLLEFQNANGLTSPAGTAQTLESIIGRLESQLTELQTRRSALLGYLVPGSPSVREIDLQIAATREQIGKEQKRLASPEGNTLNRTVEEYQRLELEAQFAQDLYRSALAALEQGRIEATRTLKKVSVLQSPSVPEYPLEPRRLYNAFVFLLFALLFAAVLNLVVVIIRDHRD
jgi:capsular polysaccharide transport system permease protein